MDGGADISKIIGIIMENPEIIDKIKGLISKDGERESEAADITISDKPSEEAVSVSALPNEEAAAKNGGGTAEKTSSEATYTSRSHNKKRRGDLLCALKPYVSKERSRAIDTMLSVIEILDIVKER